MASKLIFHLLLLNPHPNDGLIIHMFKIPWLKEVEGKQKVNHVTVFERPGLQEFLQQISEFADLVLFTAGLEG